jgi:uncharacterized membrane protein YebE (DUF533 family)
MTFATYLLGLGKIAAIWLSCLAGAFGLAAVGYVAYTAWAWWRWQRG